MPTTANKGYSTPAYNTAVGTWGTTDMNGNFTLIDTNISGVASISLSNANVTLSAAQAQNLTIYLTGTLLTNITVSTPCIGFFWVINNTTGSYTASIQSNFGAGAVGSARAVAQGTLQLFCADQTSGATFGAAPNGSYATTSQVSTLIAAAFTPIVLSNTSTPATPSAGTINVYAKSDYLAAINSSGVEKLFGKPPTVQRFTSGSGTYTPTSGTLYIRVRMCGAGAGGAGTSTGSSAGANGGTTSFGSWTAIGGTGGALGSPGSGGIGGIGGTGGAAGTGTLILPRSPGQAGGTGSGGIAIGGPGGSCLFGQGAPPCLDGYLNGKSAASYGGGGSGATLNNYASGSGGGAECLEFIVLAPTATSYSVGVAGTGGTGFYAGGDGFSGMISVEEYYS